MTVNTDQVQAILKKVFAVSAFTSQGLLWFIKDKERKPQDVDKNEANLEEDAGKGGIKEEANMDIEGKNKPVTTIGVRFLRFLEWLDSRNPTGLESASFKQQWMDEVEKFRMIPCEEIEDFLKREGYPDLGPRAA